jgi:hypothetical protein
MAKASVVRPFVAKMPAPFADESLWGYIDRALQRTMIRNARDALRLAGFDPLKGGLPNASKLADGGKLDPYADRIAAMIEAEPARGTNRLWTEFKKSEHFEVA